LEEENDSKSSWPLYIGLTTCYNCAATKSKRKW